ncbi:MAG: hypothetical protein VB125_00785 [Burkholderia sp.]
MFVSIIMKSLSWAMSFGLNAFLLHFDLETVLYSPLENMQAKGGLDGRQIGANGCGILARRG